MEFIEYPKWLHRDGQPDVLVANADAEAAQLAAWGPKERPASPRPVTNALTQPVAGDDIAALREAYKAKFGKRPFGAWGADEIKARLEAA